MEEPFHRERIEDLGPGRILDILGVPHPDGEDVYAITLVVHTVKGRDVDQRFTQVAALTPPHIFWPEEDQLRSALDGIKNALGDALEENDNA